MSGYRRLLAEMRVHAGNHWQKPCLAKSKLSFEPIHSAFPWTHPAGFKKIVSCFYLCSYALMPLCAKFLLHILLYYAMILA